MIPVPAGALSWCPHLGTEQQEQLPGSCRQPLLGNVTGMCSCATAEEPPRGQRRGGSDLVQHTRTLWHAGHWHPGVLCPHLPLTAPQLCLRHMGKLLPHERDGLGDVWTLSYTVRAEGDDRNKGVSPCQGLPESPHWSGPALPGTRDKTQGRDRPQWGETRGDELVPTVPPRCILAL